jgi:hypothetical protein
MSYVGGPFTQDLFVSYSHGSDADGKPFLADWSSAFAKALDTELRYKQPFRDALRMFLDLDHRPDRGVDPTLPLTEQLRAQISNAAMLLVLMSPDYLRSNWCKDEREWWQQSQTGHALAHDDGRMVIVHTARCDDLPDQFKALTGIPFHADIEGENRPLGWIEFPGPYGQDFRRGILRIVTSIKVALERTKADLDARNVAKADVAKLAQESGQTIYLHARLDNPLWKEATAALNDQGLAVVPGEPEQLDADPKVQQKRRAGRIELMSECDALLLLGSDDGLALDADLVTIGKHDRQSARARSNRMLPCCVLNTVGGAVATDVRLRTARNLQADWLDATQKTWAAGVVQWLKDKSAVAQAEQA